MNWQSLNQERIVLGIALLLFATASVALPGFFQQNNLVSIVRSISVLGILALGMSVVIIGRGIDLSMVAIMAMSVAWYLQLLGNGVGDAQALLLVLGGVLLIGLLNGQLDDYDDALKLALAKHPDAHIFRSFPDVGLITASTLLAEIGEDRGHYPQVGILLAEAGLAPVTRASGRSHHVGFRYAANSRLREAGMPRG